MHAAFAGAASAGSIILDAGVHSSAYLPVPIAILVAADRWRALAMACLAAFVVPFLGTLLAARAGELKTVEEDPFGYKAKVLQGEARVSSQQGDGS